MSESCLAVWRKSPTHIVIGDQNFIWQTAHTKPIESHLFLTDWIVLVSQTLISWQCRHLAPSKT